MSLDGPEYHFSLLQYFFDFKGTSGLSETPPRKNSPSCDRIVEAYAAASIGRQE